MVTDAERRKVARKLRALEVDDIFFDSELLDAIEHAYGSRRKRRDYAKIINRLADLIEPNQDNVRTVSGNIGTASGIDRDALLEIANEMRCIADEDAPFALRAFSRRIRAELGVKS